MKKLTNSRALEFLSTLSLRRATFQLDVMITTFYYFYPRSPCGERLWPGLLARPFFIISIHALLAESDISMALDQYLNEQISIHALLAESDPLSLTSIIIKQGFLSTLSLRRATLMPIFTITAEDYFYPRSPCGERREIISIECCSLKISIHALLAESDSKLCDRLLTNIGHFYPRSPCGERRARRHYNRYPF